MWGGCCPGIRSPVPVFPLACLLALFCYGAGMLGLRRRGDRWPLGRSVAFVSGLLTIVAVTGTGVGGYGMELLSVHMVQHMVLSMLSPILLLLGAPVTLALRTLRPEAAMGHADYCCASCTAGQRDYCHLRFSLCHCSS